MKKFPLTIALLISLVFAFSACLRGESKSLQGVLEAAKDRYQALPQTDLPPDVTQTLNALNDSLTASLKTTDGKALHESAKVIATQLETLIPRTGYTGRASATELRNQFMNMSDSMTPQTAELLAGRVYGFLASELESTKFGLNG